jgi:hypothetical protein
MQQLLGPWGLALLQQGASPALSPALQQLATALGAPGAPQPLPSCSRPRPSCWLARSPDCPPPLMQCSSWQKRCRPLPRSWGGRARVCHQQA